MDCAEPLLGGGLLPQAFQLPPTMPQLAHDKAEVPPSGCVCHSLLTATDEDARITLEALSSRNRGSSLMQTPRGLVGAQVEDTLRKAGKTETPPLASGGASQAGHYCNADDQTAASQWILFQGLKPPTPYLPLRLPVHLLLHSMQPSQPGSIQNRARGLQTDGSGPMA